MLVQTLKVSSKCYNRKQTETLNDPMDGYLIRYCSVCLEVVLCAILYQNISDAQMCSDMVPQSASNAMFLLFSFHSAMATSKPRPPFPLLFAALGLGPISRRDFGT